MSVWFIKKQWAYKRAWKQGKGEQLIDLGVDQQWLVNSQLCCWCWWEQVELCALGLAKTWRTDENSANELCTLRGEQPAIKAKPAAICHALNSESGIVGSAKHTYLLIWVSKAYF